MYLPIGKAEDGLSYWAIYYFNGYELTNIHVCRKVRRESGWITEVVVSGVERVADALSELPSTVRRAVEPLVRMARRRALRVSVDVDVLERLEQIATHAVIVASMCSKCSIKLADVIERKVGLRGEEIDETIWRARDALRALWRIAGRTVLVLDEIGA